MSRLPVTPPPAGPKPYIASTIVVGLACGLGLAVDAWIHPPNISMVFLAAVLYSAIRHGLRPSLYAALLSTLLYNYLFLEPRYSLTIDDPSNVVALVFLLIVAILTSNLAGRLKRQAAAAKAHAEANAALYEFSAKIAGIGGRDQLVRAAAQQLADMLDSVAVILLPANGVLEVASASSSGILLSDGDRAAAARAWLEGKPAGVGTSLPGDTAWLFAPVKSARGLVGAIGLKRADASGNPMFSEDAWRLIEALADQIAVAVERIELADGMERARIAAETERLRVALLGAISHDFRTPLSAIIGSVSTLRTMWERFDVATRQELMDTIRAESERLNGFVGNVLDMTRIEAGRLSVSREAVDLAELVADVIRQMERRIGRHRVMLDGPDDLPPAMVDPMLCRHVVVNLLDNAAKFSPPGSRIDIRLRAVGDRLRLEVLDEGPGIPPAQFDAVFDRFFRLESGDRRRAGTGLGLAICKGFVEAMGGTIAAGNRESSGAALTVTLPIASMPALDESEEPLGDECTADIAGR